MREIQNPAPIECLLLEFAKNILSSARGLGSGIIMV